RFEADANFGAVQVHDLVVEYEQTDAETKWSAKGSVQLAPGVEVEGTFEIVNGKIARIGLDWDAGNSPTALGIALGDSGMYLTHVGGKISNLDSPDDIEVDINARVTYGPHYVVMGKRYAMFEADGDLVVNKDEFKLVGDVKVIGGLEGAGTGT